MIDLLLILICLDAVNPSDCLCKPERHLPSLQTEAATLLEGKLLVLATPMNALQEQLQALHQRKNWLTETVGISGYAGFVPGFYRGFCRSDDRY